MVMVAKCQIEPQYVESLDDGTCGAEIHVLQAYVKLRPTTGKIAT